MGWNGTKLQRAGRDLRAIGDRDCCKSLLVPGGTFDRSYDGVDFMDPNYPATVSDFYLDKYEITVGRFRQFVNAGMGTQTSPPAAGAGATSVDFGLGLELDVEHESVREHGRADNPPEVRCNLSDLDGRGRE